MNEFGLKKEVCRNMHKRRIFITGATSGLGLFITDLCLKKGYEVYATGRNQDILNELAEKGAQTFYADLKNLQEIERICSQLPSIDAAIINAGVGIFESAYELSNEQIDDMLQINVRAPIVLSKLLLKEMIKKEKGHLIFIGSQAGKVATKKSSVYAASKHAITGFTNGLRMEVAPYHIKVTTVYPGPIDTPFLQKADRTDQYRHSVKNVLLNPEQVALKIVKAIEHPVREINLPKIMSITSKLYAVAPHLVEKLGHRFFNKK